MSEQRGFRSQQSPRAVKTLVSRTARKKSKSAKSRLQTKQLVQLVTPKNMVVSITNDRDKGFGNDDDYVEDDEAIEDDYSHHGRNEMMVSRNSKRSGKRMRNDNHSHNDVVKARTNATSRLGAKSAFSRLSKETPRLAGASSATSRLGAKVDVRTSRRGDKIQATMEIPFRLISVVIGKKGQKLKELNEIASVVVNRRPKYEGSLFSTISILGDADSVASIKQMIKEVIDNALRRERRENKSSSGLHDLYLEQSSVDSVSTSVEKVSHSPPLSTAASPTIADKLLESSVDESLETRSLSHESSPYQENAASRQAEELDAQESEEAAREARDAEVMSRIIKAREQNMSTREYDTREKQLMRMALRVPEDPHRPYASSDSIYHREPRYAPVSDVDARYSITPAELAIIDDIRRRKHDMNRDPIPAWQDPGNRMVDMRSHRRYVEESSGFHDVDYQRSIRDNLINSRNSEKSTSPNSKYYSSRQTDDHRSRSPSTRELNRPRSDRDNRLGRSRSPSIRELNRPRSDRDNRLGRSRSPSIHELNRPRSDRDNRLDRSKSPSIHELNRPRSNRDNRLGRSRSPSIRELNRPRSNRGNRLGRSRSPTAHEAGRKRNTRSDRSRSPSSRDARRNRESLVGRNTRDVAGRSRDSGREPGRERRWTSPTTSRTPRSPTSKRFRGDHNHEVGDSRKKRSPDRSQRDRNSTHEKVETEESLRKQYEDGVTKAVEGVTAKFERMSQGMGRPDPTVIKRLEEKRDSDIKQLKEMWANWLAESLTQVTQ